MDKNMDKKVSAMGEALAWYLLDRLKTVCNRVIHVPGKINGATSNYRDTNGGYGQYIRDRIIYGDDMQCSLEDLCNAYRVWYKDEYIEQTTVAKSDIASEFRRRFGPPNAGIYSGFGIKSI